MSDIQTPQPPSEQADKQRKRRSAISYPARETSDISAKQALVEYLQRIADDRLILGHRLSEWTGHAPILEEDIALANIALDLIGHASSLLEYAGQVEGEGRDEDDFAYFRNAVDYRNIKMVELPRGDFAFTMGRIFLFSTFSYHFYQKLQDTEDEQLRGLAQKALKEATYHVRHSAGWVRKLGDGTEESHQRMQDAIDELWAYTGELFYMDDIDEILIDANLAPDLHKLYEPWIEQVENVIQEATLDIPDTEPNEQNPMTSTLSDGGRRGFHSEHLGHLLAEMQTVRREFPDAPW
ncbi:MAG: 1,2-phenylacetyl-CoA epoxidase subunit PaaC [Bacteroidota bacterium]